MCFVCFTGRRVVGARYILNANAGHRHLCAFFLSCFLILSSRAANRIHSISSTIDAGPIGAHPILRRSSVCANTNPTDGSLPPELCWKRMRKVRKKILLIYFTQSISTFLLSTDTQKNSFHLLLFMLLFRLRSFWRQLWPRWVVRWHTQRITYYTYSLSRMTGPVFGKACIQCNALIALWWACQTAFITTLAQIHWMIHI